ncbi:penicillin acylase family protein [Actinoplanes sp. NBRC 103695]|uniref:penicillin acylase family protein n=1 Tax=Actinoplanes sp. NBRC 103695 TaxID=3032202 RepID=UPI002555D951|nr:penicillin acylase family protein [Actinoplanes sp. NBRC 103695]
MAPAQAEAASASGAVVRRTEFGIPHVRANTYRDLGVGAGYAFAEDNLCLLAGEIVTNDGERSRWFGPGNGNLESDLYHRWIIQTRVVEQALAAPSGPSRDAREMVRGYATGYNRYLARTGADGLPESVCRGAAWVRPITELDIWRRTLQLAEMQGAETSTRVIAAAQPPGTPAVASHTVPDGLAGWRGGGIGSNAIGLGREATAAGTGMLLANPHFPWDGHRRFHQVHLTLPGELNVTGATLPGLPVVAIGHTDRLAWSHTVSTAVTFTIRRLALAPGDPTSYVVDGQTHAMRRDPVTVTVRQGDGTLAEVSQPVWSTPDGPIVAIPGELPWDTAQAFQFRSANAGNLRMIDEWLAMAKARDVHELRSVQARRLGLPWVNTTAADVTGTAFYGDLQAVPHVTDELVARCGLGERGGIPVLDGSRSACAWGTDADAVVPGLLGPGRLPTLIRRDYTSNMNDSPWLANPAAPLVGYPAIVGDAGTARSARTLLGLDLIADRLDGTDGLGKPKFTLPTLQTMQLNDRNYTAEQGRAELVAFCRANPTLTASDGRAVDVRAACDTLAAWNGRGDLDARGAALWRRFVESGPFPWAVPFDAADPAHTPRGFDAARPGVGTTFANVVAASGAAGVPVDVALRDAQKYSGIGVHGCSHGEGCFNVITAMRPPAAQVQHGSSFIMAVELTRSGPRARTLLTYGQSAYESSPHRTDQIRLYNEKRWVTDRFTEKEIAADPSLTITRLR